MLPSLRMRCCRKSLGGDRVVSGGVPHGIVFCGDQQYSSVGTFDGDADPVELARVGGQRPVLGAEGNDAACLDGIGEVASDPIGQGWQRRPRDGPGHRRRAHDAVDRPQGVIDALRYYATADNADDRPHPLISTGHQKTGLSTARAAENSDTGHTTSDEKVDRPGEVLQWDLLQNGRHFRSTEVGQSQNREALLGQRGGVALMQPALRAAHQHDPR